MTISPVPSRRESTAAAVVIAFACIIIAQIEGKDFNWDFRNYHLYGPYALLGNRTHQDFMAAGPQGYINPIAHLPLYAMIAADWNDRLIAAVLALMHAPMIFVAYLLGYRFSAGPHDKMRTALAALAALLTLLSPVFFGVVGGTFSDPTVAAFSIVALYGLIRAHDSSKMHWSFAGGLCLGIGLSAKLTLIVFLPAFAACALLLAWRASSVRAAVIFILASLVAFGLASLPNAIALWREFGNPVFPFFNATFGSPYFPPLPADPHFRFIPDNLFEFLFRPFRMLDAHSFVYVENSSPDLRFAAIAIAGVGLALRIVVRTESQNGASDPAPLITGVFFLVGWLCWLALSGNGRYGLILSGLAGPGLIAGALHLTTAQRASILLFLLAALQGALVISSYPHRWTVAPWTGRWFEVNVARDEIATPHGYILVDANTNSFVIPSFHRDSGFFGVSGQQNTSDLPAVKARLSAYAKRWSQRLRVLVAVPQARSEPNGGTGMTQATRILAMYGFKIGAGPCSTITGNSVTNTPPERVPHGLTPLVVFLFSCPIVQDAVAEEIDPQAQREASEAFNRIAAACRRWFPASGDLPPQPKFGGWSRRYDATDVILYSRDDQAFLSRYDFGPFDVPLGAMSKWRSPHPPTLDCRPLKRHYLQ